MAAATVVAAPMSATTAVIVSAATVSFFVPGALSDRIKLKGSGQQRRDGGVGVALNAAVQFQPHVSQIILRAAPNSSAHNDVHVVRGKESGQRAATGPVGRKNFRRQDFAVFHVVYFKLGRMAEMLKNPAVFVSYRNSHQ